MSTDNDQIRSLVAHYYAAANAKDIDGVMACYALQEPSLLVYDVVPLKPFEGANAVRKDWTDFFSAMREIHLERSDVEISSDGNLAFGHFMENVALTTNGGEQIHAILRTTHVYKKIDGHWLIVHEHKSAPASNLHP
jgi:uncharacterized protein (TIGR02246 family)